MTHHGYHVTWKGLVRSWTSGLKIRWPRSNVLSHIYLKDPGFSVWIQYILISCTFTVIVLGSEWSSGRRITFEVSLRRLRWLKVTKGKCFKCFGSALVLPGARGVCSAGANALSEIRGQPSRRKTSNLSQCWRTLTQQPLWFLWLSCYWTSA
jgi:hypothetical protein